MSASRGQYIVDSTMEQALDRAFGAIFTRIQHGDLNEQEARRFLVSWGDDVATEWDEWMREQ